MDTNTVCLAYLQAMYSCIFIKDIFVHEYLLWKPTGTEKVKIIQAKDNMAEPHSKKQRNTKRMLESKILDQRGRVSYIFVKQVCTDVLIQLKLVA